MHGWPKSTSQFKSLSVYFLILFIALQNEGLAQPLTNIHNLPVTNTLPLTEVVFERVDMALKNWPGNKPYLRVSSYPRGETPLNWTTWRTSISNNVGTKLEQSFTRSALLDVAKVFTSPDPLSVQLTGTEYVAGEPTMLPNEGEIKVLKVSARASAYGVNHVYLMGGGTYRLKDKTLVSIPVPNKVEEGLTALEGEEFQLHCPEPTVLLVIDPTRTGVPMYARLRERPQKGVGHAFGGRRFDPLSRTTENGSEILRLYKFKSNSRPVLTTNLVEVEVVAQLPPISFQMKPPAVLEGSF